MIFDQPPAELPVATLMPGSRRARLAAGLTAWIAARWRWFRPRTVPLIAAALGMVAVVGSASYLKDYGRDDARLARLAPPPLVDPIAELAPPPAPLARLVIEQGPPGAEVSIDGDALANLPPIELSPSRCTLDVAETASR